MNETEWIVKNKVVNAPITFEEIVMVMIKNIKFLSSYLLKVDQQLEPANTTCTQTQMQLLVSWAQQYSRELHFVSWWRLHLRTQTLQHKMQQKDSF